MSQSSERKKRGAVRQATRDRLLAQGVRSPAVITNARLAELVSITAMWPMPSDGDYLAFMNRYLSYRPIEAAPPPYRPTPRRMYASDARMREAALRAQAQPRLIPMVSNLPAMPRF